MATITNNLKFILGGVAMTRHYYRDEEILKVKKEQDVYQQYMKRKADALDRIEAIKKGVLEIQGKEILFSRRSFFDHSFSMFIPDTFEQKTTEKDHYLFSIASGDVHISLSSFSDKLVPMTLKEYKKQLIKNMYDEANVNIEWIEEGLHIESNIKITYVVFTIPIEETGVYNFIFFFSLRGKTYVISCNCMQNRMDDYMILGKGLIETIEVDGEEETDASDINNGK